MPATRDKGADARAHDLAQQLVARLRVERERGEAAYPLTLEQLLRLTAPESNRDQALAAARKRTFSAEAIVAKANRLDAPVALLEDLEILAGAPMTLEFALRSMRTPNIHVRSVSQVGDWLTSAAQFGATFKRIVKRKVAEASTPPSVAWIRDRTVKLFLLEELQPPWVRERLGGLDRSAPLSAAGASAAADEPATSAVAESPAPASVQRQNDFAARFEDAFDELDRRKGSHNFVSLVDLRRELPGFSRPEFDAGLHQLRREGRFTLSAAESIHGIRPEQREAGIEEAGNLLLHVSRKPLRCSHE